MGPVQQVTKSGLAPPTFRMQDTELALRQAMEKLFIAGAQVATGCLQSEGTLPKEFQKLFDASVDAVVTKANARVKVDTRLELMECSTRRMPGRGQRAMLTGGRTGRSAWLSDTSRQDALRTRSAFLQKATVAYEFLDPVADPIILDEFLTSTGIKRSFAELLQCNPDLDTDGDLARMLDACDRVAGWEDDMREFLDATTRQIDALNTRQPGFGHMAVDPPPPASGVAPAAAPEAPVPVPAAVSTVDPVPVPAAVRASAVDPVPVPAAVPAAAVDPVPVPAAVPAAAVDPAPVPVLADLQAELDAGPSPVVKRPPKPNPVQSKQKHKSLAEARPRSSAAREDKLNTLRGRKADANREHAT